MVTKDTMTTMETELLRTRIVKGWTDRNMRCYHKLHANNSH